MPLLQMTFPIFQLFCSQPPDQTIDFPHSSPHPVLAAILCVWKVSLSYNYPLEAVLFSLLFCLLRPHLSGAEGEKYSIFSWYSVYKVYFLWKKYKISQCIHWDVPNPHFKVLQFSNQEHLQKSLLFFFSWRYFNIYFYTGLWFSH